MLQRIKHYTHKDEQRSSPKELSKPCANTKQLSKSRKNSNNGKEECPREGNSIHDRVNIVTSLLTRLYPGDKTIIALEVFCHLRWVNSDCSIEVGKEQDQDGKRKVVPEACVIRKGTHKGTSLSYSSHVHHRDRDKHDSLSKDDGHHVSSINLKRNILTSASKLFVAYDALCILYRHLASTLYQ